MILCGRNESQNSLYEFLTYCTKMIDQHVKGLKIDSDIILVVIDPLSISMTSITYHPDRRNDVLHDLSLLSICGQPVHKLETLGTVFINNRKAYNAFRRFNSPYEILLESDDHTIHFHKNYYVLESLHRLLGSQMEHLEVVAVYSYRHHGALVSPEACHIPTLRWDELHQMWSGASIYLESRTQGQEQEQWASPIASPVEEDDYTSHEESESESAAFASPAASRPKVPETPAKQAQASAAHTPSVRRCLSDRFTALLQKRTFSEVSASDSEEDTSTILRSGMKYPRNLF